MAKCIKCQDRPALPNNGGLCDQCVANYYTSYSSMHEYIEDDLKGRLDEAKRHRKKKA